MSMADLDGVELPEGGGGDWAKYLAKADRMRVELFNNMYMRTRGSGKDFSQEDIEKSIKDPTKPRDKPQTAKQLYRRRLIGF